MNPSVDDPHVSLPNQHALASIGGAGSPRAKVERLPRIAAVRYLNTLPLIEGLEKVEGLSLTPAVPSRIAEMVLAGEADIGLASIVDVATARGPAGERLAGIPVGQIGCDGPTLTVRLFSTVPFERITELHADTESHTSVILARLILRARFGCSPTLCAFDLRERVELSLANKRPVPASLEEAWPNALLMIGDKVVTDAPPAARYPHQLDLGEAWKAWTGLPFVYAVWASTRSRASDPAIRLAAQLLDRQRRHNGGRLEWLISQRAPAHRWPVDLAREYLGGLLRYECGEREQAAAARFIGEASNAGLLEGADLRWAG
jgi:chorismate dehydratase